MDYGGPTLNTHMEALGCGVLDAIDCDRNWWGNVVEIVGEQRIILERPWGTSAPLRNVKEISYTHCSGT